MVMALSLFYQNGLLTFIAGYENGGVAVMQLDSHGWATRYQATSHSQPVLSLDISPAKDFFFTSSADALIAKHPLPTKEDLLADLPERVTKETTGSASGENSRSTKESAGGISALSAAFAEHAKASPSRDASRAKAQTVPLKVVNTKHSGQQSLRVRSDGKIFVTAGWDSKIRVYSVKTMKEVAVLKWHQAGCYAAALAEVSTTGAEGNPPGSGSRDGRDAQSEENPKQDEQPGEAQGEVVVVPRLVDITVKDKRLAQARTTHWLASGSKDGKVSLWDVF